MRKMYLTTIALFAIGFMVKAQENVIKVNPLALAFGTMEIGYERVLNQKQSFQVDLGYTTFSTGGSKYSGFGIGAQYRFYIQEGKHAPEGWFLAPVANYSSSKADNFKTTVLVAGGVGGYQWNWNPITLDLYGGPAFYSVKSDDTAFSYGFDGLGVRVGFSLGFAF
ncbi:DUF3575 domain-containing protein [Flagellimonas pacifica]|uniref:DUF3575 domain-containing protein n=1 Tax=Flagellimonas pacifica TaxID=1247520 RepID=A0A285MSA9_9FLAO|nr:DUF3575 domain-containing protein [Allomuricauda parva]SNY99417.1 Protein of unknown function [Allomuricauda parva]